MKFQDSSFNGLKVTVGTKSVTHPPTHAPTHARSKSNMPHQLFQSWGHNKHTTFCDVRKLFKDRSKSTKCKVMFLTSNKIEYCRRFHK